MYNNVHYNEAYNNRNLENKILTEYSLSLVKVIYLFFPV